MGNKNSNGTVMIYRIVILLLLSAAPTGLFAQNFTAVLSGDWSSPVTWSLQGVPGTANNVLITAISTVTVTTAESCNNLTVNGSLEIDNGGSLDINGDMQISAQGGELTVNEGSVTVAGDIHYGSAFDISPGQGNFVGIKGDLYVNGDLKLQVLSGSLIIYSNLEFDEEN